jgi:predicted O-linked N-acetylglucosamine transferase (SPINDLY family)
MSVNPISVRLQQAIEEIDGGRLDVVGAITQADALSSAGDSALAITLYKYWLRANPEHPLRHVVAFNCACLLMSSGNVQSAADLLVKSIAENPDFYPTRLNLASAYERLGKSEAAVGTLNEIVDKLGVIGAQNIGYKMQALRNIGRLGSNWDIQMTALRQAVEIDSTQSEMLQHWFNRRQTSCIWPVVQPVGVLSSAEVTQRLAPLSMASYIDDPMLQLAGAKRYCRQLVRSKAPKRVEGSWPVPANPQREKLRIAYLSSDFSNHAVGYLMSDVFQNHNRKRYEISVFNVGERTNDALQQKIIAQVDRWFDIKGLSDHDAAALIVREGADIILDMNGHTNQQRTGVLALRPAPIIANWLGYPGTMGSDHHHYIIADDFIIPATHEHYYSEQVLRLPCYQPNGHLYQVPEVKETKADLGLPEHGVVFCCFNGSVKITQPVFSRWMTILNNVPDSVLWMRGLSDDELAVRLRAEAFKQGVAPDRLKFLSFRANTEYLGCHRYADIFLDTFPYGAHTTASDALRMGVPIVTLAGLSFASRVCGSLCRSAGVPELVCETPADYVKLAIELGRDSSRLDNLKQKLVDALPASTLFDSARLVRHLEGLLEQMWASYISGDLPAPGIKPIDPEDIIPVAGSGRYPDFIAWSDYESRRLEH